jgi:predicted nucleic acid-binding protein
VPREYDVGTYSFDSGAQYFLDTNIWFLIYGPVSSGDRRAATYSDGLKRLMASGGVVLIDAVIVSELANAWTRFEFKRSRGTDFKAFRNSAAFKATAADIAMAVRSILSFAKPIGTPFANISLAPLLTSFEQGGRDFNDLLIVETCRSRACVLVTDDGDMRDANLPIVTGNRSLLATASP